MCMWQWQWHRTSMQMLQVPWCILIFSLIWIETFRTWGFSLFPCWNPIAVGFFLAANLPCNVDTQTCHDWGRSQQCTSQDKLCLFATWLEVRFSPSKNVAVWSLTWEHEIIACRMFQDFQDFQVKIPGILKHLWLWVDIVVDMQVVAPVGFTFQRTCGYWVLSRAGSAHQGLPPGGFERFVLKLAYLILKRHWRDDFFFK